MLKITDDLDALIDVLPPHVAESVRQRPNNFELLEVVLDLGRLPEARYPSEEVILSEQEVSPQDIEYVTSRIGEFTADNRAGIERTLHRISAISAQRHLLTRISPRTRPLSSRPVWRRRRGTSMCRLS